MGNCGSSGNVESSRSKQIDKQLKADEKKAKTEVKLLLLGAGESGKSTVLKQMRLIHAAGFSSSEKEAYRIVVFENIVSSMQSMLEAMEILRIEMNNPQNMAYIPLFHDIPVVKKGQPYPDAYLQPMKDLWNDSGVQQSYKMGNTFALNDNVTYFYHNLDRLFAVDYIPTDSDIIRCRIKTTGIVETVFHLGPLTYRMFDVGGQRSERKKWIHCFENVTALIFVVAISGYDSCLVEDKDSNQMHEALMLFDSICNSSWFTNTSMILFLNKVDIFAQKIQHSPVSKYFPDYKGPDEDLEQTKTYFRKRFERLNRSEKKQLYPHFTDATDTKQLAHVMTAVSDIVLNDNLQTLLL
ncbi:hypothetical protein K450DRAFT_247503 [Umbelopsis ramanniana AG]|uniref:Guanine nucleotide-binding protein alpha-2 subunit n=1 Tax=Umbelopsis ramanniana AG TaxID=1314678 RepID=A0AAD5E7V3_UMBRA|nr:uncharacterized protein K450DRAFT_247503 [Umbelopsis ramanniana AG]KAI8578352.1 hypothetical protein K450DRAFT_247503 [Umbelopsis ramanniana AG]